jgi:serine/threonine protein kinase
MSWGDMKYSLFDVLHDHSLPVNAKLTIEIAMGIAQGMNYLHSLEKKIIHRDLKSHNILVNKNWQVKVADFGLSHVREHTGGHTIKKKPGESLAAAAEREEKRHYGIFGTPEWMAPEVMEGHPYNEKIDVYSFGVLLSELITRQMPFHDQYTINNYMDVVDAVLDNHAIPTIPKWCEGFLKSLVLACVSRNPSERPNFTDIILKLREFIELDDSVYFFKFDIPRIREQMMSPSPSIQAMIGGEIADLISERKIRRHTEEGERDQNGSMSPSSGPMSAGGMPPFAPASPQLNGLPGLGPLTLSRHKSSENGFRRMSRSPSLTKKSESWYLDDDDASAILERFTALLSSSNQLVQLASCRVLANLLKCSDGKKLADDRQTIIAEGGLRPLLTLLSTDKEELKREAGRVLLHLAAEMSASEQSMFIGYDKDSLKLMNEIIEKDMK